MESPLRRGAFFGAETARRRPTSLLGAALSVLALAGAPGRQQPAPAVVLGAGYLGVDEAVDGLVADHRLSRLVSQPDYPSGTTPQAVATRKGACANAPLHRTRHRRL